LGKGVLTSALPQPTALLLRPVRAATRTLESLICRFDFVSPAFQAPAMNLCDLSVTQPHRATALKERLEKLLRPEEMSQRSL
jgi:hypothetical protein